MLCIPPLPREKWWRRRVVFFPEAAALINDSPLPLRVSDASFFTLANKSVSASLPLMYHGSDGLTNSPLQLRPYDLIPPSFFVSVLPGQSYSV